MPLKIIKGPPNSGRTEELRRRYVDSLHRNPVLVVPSTDDIFAWQERLTRERGAVVGGRVIHFRDLVGEVLGRNPMDRSDIASTLRRRQVAAEALRSAWPAVGRRLESQPGLIDAALRAFDELRSELVDPDTYEHRAAESATDPTRGQRSSLLEPIGRSYREYLERLDRLGLTDDPGLALMAVAARLDRWESRPVFVAGFDDLSEVQLTLLVRLAAVTQVTVAITHENGSPAMAITGLLLARLREHGEEDSPGKERTSAAEAGRSPVLHEIERRFLQDDPDWRPLEADGSITLIRASGVRGEAEAVGGEIARLIASGTTPDEIAIAVASPAVNGPVFRDLLTEYDIAATLECETPAAATAIGQASVDLLRAAAPGGSAEDLFRYLRGPVGADREAVDLAEYRAIRAGVTSATEATAIFRRITRTEPPFLRAARGRSPGEAVCEAVRAMITTLLQSVDPGLAGTGVETEAQMATAIQRAVAELESIHGERLDRDLILKALLSGAVSTWAIPTGNTVHIASPYSLRAKRVEHLFMVSLQESDPGAGDLRGGPFLGRAVREALRMSRPNDPEEQERYLFHSCLSVPTRGLYLSCRIADESGKTEYPSPLIGEVTALFDGGSGEGDTPSGGIEVVKRTASDILFPLERAPGETEVIRSLAVAEHREDRPGSPRIPAALARRGGNLLGLAEAVEVDTRTLSNLTDPENLERLAARAVFSPTALEAFTGCPYRWLIERGFNLERFGPEPDYFSRGSMIHEVLATLFSERTGQRPRPDTLREWLDAIDPAIETAAEGMGLDPVSGPPETIVMLRGIRADIEGQIRLEAGFEEPRLDPRYFEVSFGFEESEKGPLRFDGENPDGLPAAGWELCGRIDRVDVAGDPAVGRRGAVIDYKSGKSSILSWSETVRKRRLQLQLYLKALDALWQIRPVAGLYQPVARGSRRPRGPIDIGSYDDVAFMRTYPRDGVDIQAAIDDATAEANQAVARIRAGMIEHDPLTCPDHFEHAAVPDWQHPTGHEGGAE